MVESDVADLKFRADSQVYFRTVDRQLKNETDEQSRWGDADAHDRNRKPHGKGRYNDKGSGNESIRTFQRDYRSNYRCVNCAEREEDPDNESDRHENWDTSDYQRGHTSNMVNLAGDENDYSESEIEYGDIADWDADIEVGYYSVSRSSAGEYRDAGPTEDCDALKTLANKHLDRRYLGKKRWRWRDSNRIYGNEWVNTKVSVRSGFGILIAGMFPM